jgi:hypothetical protein
MDERDPIKALAAAGLISNVDRLAPEQIETLKTLTWNEVQTLITVKNKLQTSTTKKNSQFNIDYF